MNISHRQNIYSFNDRSENINYFPKGVYNTKQGVFGSIYFEKKDDITLPEKIYSNDTDFINHVIYTWEKSNDSIGIFLTGGKGLGKSFTANILCVKSGVPVFRLTDNITSNVIDEFNKIEQPHVIFIDEFEKIFSETKTNDGFLSQEDFLSFLDGNDSKVKRMFIITSNENINKYFINRPSRLRYVKEYKILEENIIREILTDKLENKEFLEDIVENINIENINIDILIKIVEEVNIHNKPYSTFKDFFNFKIEDPKYVTFIDIDNKSHFIYNHYFDTNFIHEMIDLIRNKQLVGSVLDSKICYIDRLLDDIRIGNDYYSISINETVPFTYKDKCLSFGVKLEEERERTPFIKGTFKIERVTSKFLF
jgi:hypothetical protein